MRRRKKKSDDRQPRLQFGAVERFEAYARKDDPITSQVAARTCNASWSEFKFLEALRDLGGRGTSEAVAQSVKVRFPAYRWRDALSPRAAPLRRKGFIEPAGTMPNLSGNEAIAWRLTTAGEEHLRDGFKGRTRRRREEAALST